MSGEKPIPVTLVSGFVGAGRTDLLQAVLENDTGLRFAILIQDFASISYDSGVISTSVAQKVRGPQVFVLTARSQDCLVNA